MKFDVTALEPLDRAILEFIQTIPARWENYHINDLSSTQEKASRLLVGAGFVELRNTLRFLMTGDSRVLRVRFRATGEQGLSIVTEQVLQAAPFWRHNGKLKNQVRCEREHASQRRLTDQGEKAHHDLLKNQSRQVLDYVKKTGAYAFRPTVDGHGIIESLEIVEPDAAKPTATAAAVAQASIGDITIQNHQNIRVDTDSLAAVFSAALEKLGQTLQPPKPTDSQEQSACKGRAWTAEELNEAVRQYRAKRAATLQEFVSILDNPNASTRQKKLAHKNARKLFGRNVIARELGVKSARMVGDTPAWKSIAALLMLSKRSSDIALSDDSRPISSANLPNQRGDCADVSVMQQEQEKTRKCLREFATSMRKGAREHAKSLMEAYESGQMTDEQIRQTIKALTQNTP